MGDLISDQTVARALALLEQLRDPSWKEIYWEYQDNFRSVLFFVHVTGLSREQIDFSYASIINDEFDKLFPGEPGEFVWVLNFYSDGSLVTAYVGGLRPSAP